MALCTLAMEARKRSPPTTIDLSGLTLLCKPRPKWDGLFEALIERAEDAGNAEHTVVMKALVLRGRDLASATLSALGDDLASVEDAQSIVDGERRHRWNHPKETPAATEGGARVRADRILTRCAD